MIIISIEEIKEMFKGFTCEQLVEINWNFKKANENLMFRLRRVNEDMIGLVMSELERRGNENHCFECNRGRR